jgi:hypothetical protein
MPRVSGSGENRRVDNRRDAQRDRYDVSPCVILGGPPRGSSITSLIPLCMANPIKTIEAHTPKSTSGEFWRSCIERAGIELSMRTKSCLSPIDSFEPILGRRRALRGSKQTVAAIQPSACRQPSPPHALLLQARSGRARPAAGDPRRRATPVRRNINVESRLISPFCCTAAGFSVGPRFVQPRFIFRALLGVVEEQPRRPFWRPSASITGSLR